MGKMDAGAFGAAREQGSAPVVECPFRVALPGTGTLCFEPLGRTLEPPAEDVAEAFCRRDPLCCPVCRASLAGLRRMLLECRG